ncbi:MAG: hypothetical protein ACXW3P_01515 [Rhodospirillales bacterium]
MIIEGVGDGYDTAIARDTDYALPPNVEKLEMDFAVYGTDPENRHGWATHSTTSSSAGR